MSQPKTKAEGRRKEDGQIRSQMLQRGPMWRPAMLDSLPRLAWECKLAIPYDPAKHSKNQSFTIRRYGKKAGIGRTDATKGGKDALAQTIAQTLLDEGARPVIAKLYVGLFLQKVNWQSDSHNLVDIVMDAIELATGINDRWYVTSEVNWEMIIGQRPMFYIHLCQWATEDSDTCSYCGEIEPLSELRTTSSYRICKVCDGRV